MPQATINALAIRKGEQFDVYAVKMADTVTTAHINISVDMNNKVIITFTGEVTVVDEN